MIDSETSFSKARRAVSTYARDLQLGNLALAEPAYKEPARKRVEYALLIGPLSRGLGSYLDSAEADDNNQSMNGPELLDYIGLRLAKSVLEQLSEDPSSFSLASRLASARAGDFEPPLSESIYPLGKTIITAATSSANAMYDAASANALTIVAAGGQATTSSEAFLSAVKRSTRLPLARTFAALAWQQAIDEAIYQHAVTLTKPGQSAEPILYYDERLDEVRLAKPFEQWADHLDLSRHGQSATIGDIAPADERLGCPVSFRPKVVIRYYHHMVDMMERHQSWPPVLDQISR